MNWTCSRLPPESENHGRGSSMLLWSFFKSKSRQSSGMLANTALLPAGRCDRSAVSDWSG